MSDINEINIIQLHRRLTLVSERLPDYDENKKGFDMCLMLFTKALKICPSVNLLRELEIKKSQIKALELLINDLREDNKVLTNRNKQSNLKTT
ncbi:hypothetical protein [uncultured Clostridium sp.]|uniref:hypothetical protein n=1 Tax=uncultured Clostridium sp. TaxID=59620 RepID=UPI00260DF6CD|nr:hypothetical protein [uncultured Clostridium sp.]